MKKKIRVGIDVDEVLRAKWAQFDKYYNIEFGEEGIPDDPYCFDYFENYAWAGIDQMVKEMIEPEDMPQDLSPLDYVVDEITGVAPADLVLFKSKRVVKTAKEVYNTFMYEDYLFEIFGTAPLMYKGLDYHFNLFHKKFVDNVELVIVSNENIYTIPSTLSFLSRMLCRASNFHFTETSEEKWEDVDILISADPEILKKGKSFGKKLVKIIRPFNVNEKSGDIDTIQIFELMANPEFLKMVKFSADDEDKFKEANPQLYND